MRHIFAVLLLCGAALAATTYISQSGGSVSCAGGTQTTISLATFNASSPSGGNTYIFCGNLTSVIAPAGSGGTTGNLVTLQFDSASHANVSMSAGNCPISGIIQLGSWSYYTLNGNSTGADDGDLTGTIRCMAQGTPAATITNITCSAGTATVTGPSAFGFTPGNAATTPNLVISGNSVSAYNTTITVLGNSNVQTGTSFTFTPSGGCAGTGSGGTVGVLCPSGSFCTDTTAATGLYLSGGSNYTVENMKVYSLYVHTSVADLFNQPYPYAVQWLGNNITITGNIFKDFGWIIGEGNTITFSNNQCINFDHCFASGVTAHNVNYGPYYIFDNTMSHAVTWDTGTTGAYHHDGVHLFAYVSGAYDATTFIHDVYMYNNHFSGNWGPINVTAHIFQEYNIKNVWIFNNLFDCSANQCDSGIVYGGINMHFWNNTLFGITEAGCIANVTAYGYSSGECNNGALTVTGSTTLSQQNNVWTTGEILPEITATDEGGSNPTTIAALSNNVYMNGGGTGGNPWNWQGTPKSSISAWNTASGETNDVYSATNTVNSGTLTLQAGSPAIGAGVNLHSTCNGQPNPGLGALCSDYNGNSRPSSGAWDAGAINSSNTVTTPPAPATMFVQLNQQPKVELAWDASTSQGVNYSIFRSVAGSPFKLIKTGLSDLSWTDTDVIRGTKYTYENQAYYPPPCNNNCKSVMSDQVNVNCCQ